MGTIIETDETIIAQTKKWIRDIVVGCNFCPFAAREVNRNTIHYLVERSHNISEIFLTLLKECARLDTDPAVQTTFLILPDHFSRFSDYLEIVGFSETLLRKKGYEGVYQVASFHPQYRFSDSDEDDPANYTNRSIYPMLHLLKEDMVENAVAKYPHPEKIPDNNIEFARSKGLAYMKMLWETSHTP